MLIGADSPLRRPPILEARERLFVDGLRWAVDVADYGFCRLRHCLLAMTEQGRAAGSEQGQSLELNIAALIDAWAMVDAVDRLRGLLLTRGGVMKGFPAFKHFVDKTAAVRTLRNNCDHIGQKLEWLASRDMAVHGVLGWAAELPNGEFYVGMFKAGTLSKKTQLDPIVNPLGQMVERPVGMVTLTMGKDEVRLSDVFRELATFVGATESALSTMFAGAPAAGGDLLALAQIEFGGTQATES